jgi:hypothetical protein
MKYRGSWAALLDAFCATAAARDDDVGGSDRQSNEDANARALTRREMRTKVL